MPKTGIYRNMKFPDYLWGIETCDSNDLDKVKEKVSRLPMRNWNDELKKQGENIENCFQTTYEELKPFRGNLSDRIGVKFPDYLWGIETIFHLLSFFLDTLFPDYLWGIETQLPKNINIFPQSVSRLPMRNWNIHQFPRHRDNCHRFQTTYEELKLW